MRSSILHRLPRPASFVAALLLSPVAVRAQDVEPPERPFLWRIDAPGAAEPSYLFGTIHLPDERVTTLHPAVEAALLAADEVYTELPMDLATMTSAATKMVLPGRKTLEDVLPPELYERLKAFLAARNLPIGPLSRLQIWAIATQIPLIEHLAEIASGEALDMKLYRMADDEGKVVGGLETVDEQVGVFAGLSEKEQAQLLIDALDQVEEASESGKDLLDEIVTLYVGGDAEALMKLMHETSSPDEELQRKLEEALLWTRNRRMADRIARKINGAPDDQFFFAVGAAHMPAAQGIVALLEARGFTLTRLPETAATVRARIAELEAELAVLRERLRKLEDEKSR